MSGWIKFDKDLIDDPRVIRAAEFLCGTHTVSIESVRGHGFASGADLEEKEQLAFMRNAVTGALLTLWVYADTHIRDGDVLPISMKAIDHMVGISGFCELIGEDWIRKTEDEMSVVLPGYCGKNGLISKEKRKASNADRQRRFRERTGPNRNAHSNAVSNAVSNADVTRLDLDLDLKKDKPKVAPLALPEWIDREKFEAWWKTRPSRARKPEALKGALQKLEAFRSEGHNPNAIVANSLANGWQGLFAPKSEAKPVPISTRPSITCTSCGRKAFTWTGGQCDPCWRKGQGLAA